MFILAWFLCIFVLHSMIFSFPGIEYQCQIIITIVTTRFIWWMYTEHRVAANPQIKPIDLGCESAENWQLPSTSTVTIVIITKPVGWCSFYYPTESGRLSWPKHCSKCVHPVPKAACHSCCRNKHNHLQWDSNLGPLTRQSDALTTRLLRPALECA